MLDFPDTMKRVLAGLKGAGNAMDPDGEWTEARRALMVVPGWAAEAGAAFRQRDGAFLVWLAPGEGKKPAFPSCLKIDPPAKETERGGAMAKNAMARRSIVTWDTGKKAVTGSEIFTGSPILAGPPFDGAALIVMIRTLGMVEIAAADTSRHDMEQ